ncbi:U4/U6.U5 small nuclear ribonucleoprotein 27 kDa protein yantar [Arctopsyche grandis]|uniref:U4/U6.U5 small nuclear ribonucleoprotein 27 kDa protein yantar n=1 Tax=Arctopsyche grandis TaxID=121162 RepID=UPI00406D9AC3
MGRSPSPSRRREDSKRERDRERDRERERRRHRSRERERSRSRERRRRSAERRRRSRSRSTSAERASAGGKPQRTAVPDRPAITQADLEGKSPEEQEMIRIMGFSGFNTTKGKKVDNNDVGEVQVVLKRKYRQYMNRKGGFNRPLDFVA